MMTPERLVELRSVARAAQAHSHLSVMADIILELLDELRAQQLIGARELEQRIAKDHRWNRRLADKAEGIVLDALEAMERG